MIVHICINIFSHRKLPDTVIQHQITIQMLLSLLLLWHIILSLSLSLPSCFHFVKPLFLFIRSLLFRSQPFVSLWAGLKSTSRGCVCGWGRPTTCRTLYWKGVLYFSRGQQAVCTCLCVYSFFFLLFFFSRWKQTEYRHNKITAQKIRAARNQIHMYTFLHEIHPSRNYSNAQIIYNKKNLNYLLMW